MAKLSGFEPLHGTGANVNDVIELAAERIAAVAGQVSSVAGKTGDVIVVHTDISDWESAIAGLGSSTVPGATVVGGVSSVAGKAGDVILVHTDITDWNAAVIGLGVAVSTLGAAGPQRATDVKTLQRAGVDLQTTVAADAAASRLLPTAPRVVVVTGQTSVLLTSADAGRIVRLTGTVGSCVLGTDGSLIDGTEIPVINACTAAIPYSGINGLLGTTSLSSGARGVISASGGVIEASTSGSGVLVTATAFTVTGPSPSTAGPNVPVTLNASPTAGAFPAGATLTGSIASSTSGTLTGTFSGPVTLSASTATVPITFTPTSAAGTAGTLLLTVTGPGMTNTTGAVPFTVAAVIATSYAVSVSTQTPSDPGTMTLVATPNGNWPAGAGTFTPSGVSPIGTVSPGSIAPTAGNATPASFNITVNAAASTTLNIVQSGQTATLTNTTPAGIAVTSSVSTGPTYPTLTGTREATFDGNAGVTSSAGAITAVADTSGQNGPSITASAGVTVGTAIKSNATILFTGYTQAAMSGLKNVGGAAWTNNMRGDCTIPFVLQTGSVVPATAALFDFSPGSLDSSNRLVVYLNSAKALTLYRIANGTQTLNPALSGALAANTLYRGIVRISAANGVQMKLNGVDSTPLGTGAAAVTGNTWSSIAIGQNAFSALGDGGLDGCKLAFIDFISNHATDTEATNIDTYLTTRFV